MSTLTVINSSRFNLMHLSRNSLRCPHSNSSELYIVRPQPSVRCVKTASEVLRGGYMTESNATGDLLKDVYGCYDAASGWTSDEEMSIAARHNARYKDQQTSTTAPTVVSVLPDHLKSTILTNALVLIDKPKEWTAMDAVSAVKYSVKAKKAGHLGVLDPQSTGLIIIALNQATELSAAFKGLPKTYTGVIRLGTATSTYDATGKLADRLPWKHITGERAPAGNRLPAHCQHAASCPRLTCNTSFHMLHVNTAAAEACSGYNPAALANSLPALTARPASTTPTSAPPQLLHTAQLNRTPLLVS
jgi:hypothetical protein